MRSMVMVGLGRVMVMAGCHIGSVHLEALMRVGGGGDGLSGPAHFRANHGRRHRTPDGEQQRNQQQHDNAKQFHGEGVETGRPR